MSQGPYIIDMTLLNLLLRELAASEDTVRTVVLAGGSAMLMLYGDSREPTGDLDAVLAPGSPPVATQETLARIREDYGLGETWYDGLLEVWGRIHDPRSTFFAESEPAATFTTDRGTLHVRTVKKEFLVALKMDAGRDGNDIADLGKLARDLGLTSPHQLVDLYERKLPYLFLERDKGIIMQTAVRALKG